MANLATVRIKTDGEYQDVSVLTGITFTVGSIYTFQCIGTAYVRIGETGKGFRITEDEKVKYKHAGDIFYIMTEKDELFGLNKSVTFNIAEDIL